MTNFQSFLNKVAFLPVPFWLPSGNVLVLRYWHKTHKSIRDTGNCSSVQNKKLKRGKKCSFSFDCRLPPSASAKPPPKKKKDHELNNSADTVYPFDEEKYEMRKGKKMVKIIGRIIIIPVSRRLTSVFSYPYVTKLGTHLPRVVDSGVNNRSISFRIFAKLSLPLSPWRQYIFQ